MLVTPLALAQTLLHRHRRDAEVFFRRAEALRTQVRELAGQVSTDGAWIIGSLASGSFGERSDVDVVVRGLTTEEIAHLWQTWTKALGEPLDLLRFEELPADFQRRVLAEGLRVA